MARQGDREQHGEGGQGVRLRHQGSFKHAITLFKTLLKRFNGVVIKSN
jgi:hypothetical protein